MSKINPAHSALLIMDYQNGIIDRIPDGQAIVQKMNGVIKEARALGLTIGFIRVAFADDDYAKISQNNKAFGSRANGNGMHADSPETQIHELIKPEAGDIVVRKVRVGAFSTTDLDKQLKDRSIDTLFLAGFSTGGVMLSTVADAADKDYKLFVLEDLTADPDPELHDTLVNKIFAKRADIINSNNINNYIN